MKKVAFFIILIILISCSKKSTPAPDVTITYHISGSTEASYYIGYTGPDGKPVNITFTGINWSKTITANQAGGFTNAVLSIMLTSQSTVVMGDADISVNNKISNQVPITLNSDNGSTDLTFYATVFK